LQHIESQNMPDKSKLYKTLQRVGLSRLWETDGPGNNNVAVLGMALGPNGVLFHYQIYKDGRFDLYRPVTISNKVEDTERAAIQYIKSLGG